MTAAETARPSAGDTRDGDGPRWDAIRAEVLERDEYTCQRCGYARPAADDQGPAADDQTRPLQAHHVASHARPSLANTGDLVTLCRPCHSTVHPADPAYEPYRDAAPKFPRLDAPPSVSTMRSDRQHVCQRCQHVANDATDLAAYTAEDGRTYTVCEPCAGVLLQAGYDPAAFEVAGTFDADRLQSRADEAPVRPALLAPRAVRALRGPQTTVERVIYDTPLRYVFNPLGLTLLFVVLGVAAAFFLL